MTAIRTITIECDACHTEAEGTANTAAAIRGLLRTQGWRQDVDGDDICAVCLASLKGGGE